MSTDQPTPGPKEGDAPPTYVPSQPQILVAPLPDSPSFFWGRTVQAEVFVKGLGDKKGNRGVKSLSAKLELTNALPDHPSVVLHQFESVALYPPPLSKLAELTSTSTSSSAPPCYSDAQFSTSHRFSFPLPPSISPNSPLPGTLNLTSSRRGEIKYTLTIILALSSGSIVEEIVPVEGTPQDVSVGHDPEEIKEETEEVLERDGVKTRFVLETNTPRLGDLVRLGIEVRPMERQKTGVAGLSSQPNPTDTLRPLRRVRVELFRRVKIIDTRTSASSSSTNSPDSTPEHLTLLFTSGKSLRYPGTSRVRPPLRVMFTLPTAQLGTVAGDTYGEITSSTPYHQTTFFIRVTIGFGGNPELLNPNQAGPSTSTNDVRDWYIEQSLTIRPKLWNEPRQVIIHGGQLPASGLGADIGLDDLVGMDEATKAAYRAKGLDIVGDQGTYRASEGVSGSSGPSYSHSHSHSQVDHGPPLPSTFGVGTNSIAAAAANQGGAPSTAEGELPSFIESQAQMQAGEGPILGEGVQSERLVPVQFEDDSEERANTVGRRNSLGGELGTWVEYDGYETFSMAPPPAAVSYGVDSSMDPPQEGDEDVNVMGGMVARLGLGEGGVVRPGAQAELMEQLGLGEGTRVVDLQDDLPPGIDEPSLPGLPGTYTPHTRSNPYSPPPPLSPRIQRTTDTDNPPSFAASEAAQAVGGVASAQRTHTHTRADVVQLAPVVHVASEAPPGYFGDGAVVGSGATGVGPVGGLPPYSQG